VTPRRQVVARHPGLRRAEAIEDLAQATRVDRLRPSGQRRVDVPLHVALDVVDVHRGMPAQRVAHLPQISIPQDLCVVRKEHHHLVPLVRLAMPLVSVPQ
jgi:hypothetical protein